MTKTTTKTPTTGAELGNPKSVNQWLLSLEDGERQHVNTIGKWELAEKVWDVAQSTTPAHPTGQAVIEMLRRAMDSANVEGEVRGMLVGFFANEWNNSLATPVPQQSPEAGSIVDTPEFRELLSATEVASPDRDDGEHMRKRYEASRFALVSHLEKVMLEVTSRCVVSGPELIPVAKVGYIPGHYEAGLEAEIIDRSLVHDGMTLFAAVPGSGVFGEDRND